jgi:predicted ATPase
MIKKFFIKHCEDKSYEINQNQLVVVDDLKNFYTENFKQNLITKFFKKKDIKLGFYLMGDVGVGKTMILNFFFNRLNEKKMRLHFNEFMIKFHDFIFENKDKSNGIDLFVKDLNKSAKLIYFDEFQVTNIVDAMILGKLFEKIFQENIKIILTSNT